MLASLLGGFAKNVILGQLRTWLPFVGGALTVLGLDKQVGAKSLEGSIYYIANAAFVVVPALFSYLDKKSVATLVSAAIAATPGTPQAAAIQAKVT